MIKKNYIYENLQFFKNEILQKSNYNNFFILENIENKIEYFNAITQTEIPNGIRYFEVSTKKDLPHSIIRYLDVTNNGIKKVSEWFDVDADEKGLFFEENGKKHYIGNLELNNNKIKIPINIKKDTKRNQVSDNYTIWKVDLFKINDDNTIDEKNLGNIYTNQENFPTRSYIDKLRVLLNGRISYENNVIKVLFKEKDKENMRLFISKSNLYLNEDELQKLKEKYKNEIFFTPDDFINYIRNEFKFSL